MAIDRLKNIRISGIACCVPENIVKTDIFSEDMGEKALKKFKKTTGIEQKHCCRKDHVITTGDLCFAAAEKLIKELDVDRQTIDAVILVTQTPDYGIMPATACVLQYRLGLSENCMAYDINLGCSGYPYGIHAAGAYMQSGYLKKVLLLEGEAGAHMVSAENMLFGEAGTATLIEYDEEQPVLTFMMKTQGAGFPYIIAPYGCRHDSDLYMEKVMQGEKPAKTLMDGAEVFNFSIREVPILVREYCGAFGYTLDDFDFAALHQANLIILNQIMKKTGLPKAKCPISLDIYGNTSSASVPLTICDYFNRLNPQEKTEEKKKILICGYGVGLSLAISSFEIAGSKCFPVFTTNENFQDGVL